MPKQDYLMVPTKGLDESKIIAALLQSVSNAHGVVFNTRSCNLTIKKAQSRLHAEGIGFLTKTLPRLGKAFDKALAEGTPLNATELGFDSLPSSKLPRFLGEFFSRILRPDGVPLEQPCVLSISVIRDVSYLFYKYEIPYSDEQEQTVLDGFKEAEKDLETLEATFKGLEVASGNSTLVDDSRCETLIPTSVLREARILLEGVFKYFDPANVVPRHGPGVVATKQQLWGKYAWANVSHRITDVYPFDAYFCASLGHVCDSYRSFAAVQDKDLPARVILVPKDSRGPRLISCEPVDFQWVQQGLGRAIVSLVEAHPLTRGHVNFTDQTLNRMGALNGSKSQQYATLDLKEASDRVSVDLVRLLFPRHVFTYLEACRSSSTVLPDGEELKLRKFAPMGSCLCFPVMALTIWAILAGGAPDKDTRDGILVYGDDVIVPAGYTADAIEHLESFGLKINRDKSCTSGFFRESCGMDAFQGVDVTPVRLRTVWSSSRRPDVYTSWIAYANSFYDKRYYALYELIVKELTMIYGPIPGEDMNLSCPSLRRTPLEQRPLRRRWNKNLQKFEYQVFDVKSPVINKAIDGWSMLLRYFTEKRRPSVRPLTDPDLREALESNPYLRPETGSGSVSEYTSPRTSMLVRRWR
jgi:hypothetical protein